MIQLNSSDYQHLYLCNSITLYNTAVMVMETFSKLYYVSVNVTILFHCNCVVIYLVSILMSMHTVEILAQYFPLNETMACMCLCVCRLHLKLQRSIYLVQWGMGYT